MTRDRKARQGQSTMHNAITHIEHQAKELEGVAVWAQERQDFGEAENVRYAIGKLNDAAEALRLCI